MPGRVRDGEVIQTQAPTRIDLAGGTFNLYPLYLFEDGGLTVNIAINLLMKVRIEPIRKGIDANPQPGLWIVTQSTAPPGSGLVLHPRSLG